MVTVMSPKMKDRFRSAAEIPSAMGINGVIFGVPGVGKTVLCASAQDSPHGKDVLFIDVEGGTRSISDRKDIQVFRPSSYYEMREIFEFLCEEKHPFKTIVIDTLNELQRLGMKDILEESKNPDWPGIQEWGKSTEQIVRMVRAFRNEGIDRGWNVFFTAHANEQKDEVTGAILIRPNLTPKATETVCGAVDFVGYLSKNRDGNRELLLEPTRTIVAKYRQPLTGVRLPSVIVDPNMVDILEHLRTGGIFHEAVTEGEKEVTGV